MVKLIELYDLIKYYEESERNILNEQWAQADLLNLIVLHPDFIKTFGKLSEFGRLIHLSASRISQIVRAHRRMVYVKQHDNYDISTILTVGQVIEFTGVPFESTLTFCGLYGINSTSTIRYIRDCYKHFMVETKGEKQ